MEMVSSVPVAQEAVIIVMMSFPMSLFTRRSVCFSVRLSTPKIIKISCGNMPLDPPRINNCRVAMFSILANDIAPPPHGISYARPWESKLMEFFVFVNF